MIEFEGYEKFYVGSSSNLLSRKRRHLINLRKNKHTNRYLQNVFNKYGEKSFRFRVIAICENNKDYLLLLEQRVIDAHDFNILLNICQTAGSPDKGFSSQRKFSSTDIEEIFNLYANGRSQRFIAKMYSCDKSIISSIISRKTYVNIPINKDIVLLAQANIEINKDKKCSAEEVKFIKENYFKMTKDKMSEIMKRSKSSILATARRLGLTKKYRVSND